MVELHLNQFKSIKFHVTKYIYPVRANRASKLEGAWVVEGQLYIAVLANLEECALHRWVS